jgi:hypothetical protein
MGIAGRDHVRDFRLESGDAFALDRETMTFLDPPKVRFGLRAHEADRRPRFASAAGVADAMNVVRRRPRKVVVHDDRQLWNVDPPRAAKSVATRTWMRLF